MSPLARRSLSLSDGNISYLAREGSGTALHFAHATGFNAETYAPLLAALPETIPVYAADARGHGLTTLPAIPGSARNWTIYGRDLSRFLDAAVSGPLILAGHSMGAVVSAMYAAERPERVRGLVLVEPVFMPNLLRLLRLLPFSPPSIDLAARAERRRAAFPSLEAARESYTGRGAFRTWPDQFLQAYLRGGLIPTGEGPEMRLACAPSWEAETFRGTPIGASRLGRKIRCPVTLIYAEQSTPPERECKVFAKSHGHTRLIRVPGTTHFLPMERPDIVKDEILRLKQYSEE